MSRSFTSSHRSWQLMSVILVLCVGQLFGAAGAAPNDDATSPDKPAMAVHIRVMNADGTAATRAIGEAHSAFGPMVRAVADSDGRLALAGDFLDGLRLHVRSENGQQHKTLAVMASDLRSRVQEPTLVRLKPASRHEVLVSSGDRPIAGAEVVVRGNLFRSSGVTDRNGLCTVQIPDGDEVETVVAWHARLGVAGWRKSDDPPTDARTELSLYEPKPHLVKLVDATGNPVEGVEISASVRLESSGWIIAREISATLQTSDERGEVHFPWFPKDGLKYVDVEVISRDWKKNKTDQERIREGVTTVQIQRQYPIEGRVQLRGNEPIAGLLISGFGFGPENTGHLPRSRTRTDGSFLMNVPAGHGFIMGISDREWTSDLWTGELIPVTRQPQQGVVINGYPATTLTIEVSRGSDREPVDQALVEVSRPGRVEWTDESGKSRTGNAGVRDWFRTNDRGIATAGVARGEVEVRLSSGDWQEKQSLEVTSEDAPKIVFHREWKNDRIVTAKPYRGDASYRPSEQAVVLAWTERPSGADAIHRPTITEEGWVSVAFDEETLAVLLLDGENKRSGFARVDAADAELRLEMLDNATYGGILIDRFDDAPLSHRTLKILTESSFLEVAKPQVTDGQGRFEFRGLPARVPLRLSVLDEPGKPRYFLFDGQRMFEPGETRTDDRAGAALMDGNMAVRRESPERDLARRIADAGKNASSMGMGTLVAVRGDDTSTVQQVTGTLLNGNQTTAVLGYLPVNVSRDELARSNVDHSDWPLPKSGEVSLILLGNEHQRRAAITLDCGDVDASKLKGTAFLENWMPKRKDVARALVEAQADAKKSNRCLWVIRGGPRCGPCFQLARWIDEHRDILEKDLVVVKSLSGRDKNLETFDRQIGGLDHGIPFHVLMSSDGEILWSSDGPLGNIGMPSSVEGIRHLREMFKRARQRITEAELETLFTSLSDSN